MLARPDILHPIDDKIINHNKHCSHHKSGLYANNFTSQESKQSSDSHNNSQDSIWWSKEEFKNSASICECSHRHDVAHGGHAGVVRDVHSLPHLGCLDQGAGGYCSQTWDNTGGYYSQAWDNTGGYYSQAWDNSGSQRKIIREIIV